MQGEVEILERNLSNQEAEPAKKESRKEPWPFFDKMDELLKNEDANKLEDVVDVGACGAPKARKSKVDSNSTKDDEEFSPAAKRSKRITATERDTIKSLTDLESLRAERDADLNEILKLKASSTLDKNNAVTSAANAMRDYCIALQKLKKWISIPFSAFQSSMVRIREVTNMWPSHYHSICENHSESTLFYSDHITTGSLP